MLHLIYCANHQYEILSAWLVTAYILLPEPIPEIYSKRSDVPQAMGIELL